MHDHTKLFLPAELVRRNTPDNEPDTKIVRKKNLAQPRENKEVMDKQKRINEAKDELKLGDWDLDVSLLDVEMQKKILEEIEVNKLQRVEEIAQVKRAQEEGIQRIQAEAARQIKFQKAVQPTSNNPI